MDTTGSIIVYKRVRTDVRVCEFGDKHSVETYVTRRLWRTDEQKPYDTGYGMDMSTKWVDYKGRAYWARYPIDYCGSTTYVSDEDPHGRGHWSGRKPFHNAVDILGRVIK